MYKTKFPWLLWFLHKSLCLHKEYLYLSKNQADIGTYISYKAWKSSPFWLMHDKLGTGYVLMNSVWGSRLIHVFCSIWMRWCDVFNHLLATLGLKLYGLFLISHRNEKDKLLSFKQMSIFDLVLYSIMQPIMPHLNFLWKRAFYIKKISFMNLHTNFFF